MKNPLHTPRRSALMAMLLASFASAVVSACLPAQSLSPLTETAVRSARARSNAAIAKRDTTTLVSLVSQSYHSVSSRNAHTNGRDQVGAQWRDQFAAHADVSYVRTPASVRVFTPWEMAEELGTWVGRWTEPDGQVEIRGTYSAKWRRIDGAWLLEAEVFTPRTCTGSKYCITPPEQPRR